MKISLDWIKDFIDISGINLDVIESKLTDLGLESKIINDDFTFSNDIVLGKIVDIKKHSNADKLKICLIDIGEKNCKEIICGATNVKKNIYVPVAKKDNSLATPK
jgi:phenylalanyl-tRNA synthetase beta chain